MRVAVWTPLPPEPSGIADYNMVLLKAMARSPGVELTAIVRDDADHAVAPPGVRVRHAREYRGEDYDIDLYHVGNNPTFHTYMLQPALSRAGVLVLHDPAIADFIEVVLGGRQRKIFEVEAAFNLGLSERDDAVVDAINQWDRTTLLLSRRLIEANHVTLVHSAWAAAHLSARFTGAEVHAVPFAVEIDPQRLVPRRHLELTFGVFGNISFHKRVPEVVAAFAEARRRGLRARLIVAGRRDSTEAERRIERLIDSERLADHVDFHVDVAGDDFRRLQESCDVLVGLRWPTAGETSASLLECFALGKAAIVSDVAQNAEFPEEFCRRIGLDARYEHEELVSALLDAATDIAATRDAGRAALEYVTAHCRAEDVARRYVQELRRASALAPLVDPFAEEIDPIGVNAIGSWAGATGLAEAGRRALLALLDEGISVALEDVNLWAKIDTSRVPHRIATLPHGHPYRIAVSFLNVNEFHVITDSQLRGASTDYLIAMWYWELPSLPEEMHKEIARVDEIWVASEFVREVFLRYTKKPIFVMPCVVQPEPDDSLSREDLGLPGEDVVIYLVTFDANSTIARKNPYGAIFAFEEAFGCVRTDVVLVVKVINLSNYPVVQRDLRHHMERLGGILIEDDMSPGEIAALIHHCDVYVSMHRSEGFGLGLAEAMYFGRPVIATGNSGNMDFMNATNSCLVGYRSMVVHRNELSDNPTAMVLYQPGNLWVDPDVHEAARLMRWLFEHPGERVRIGALAAADIRSHYSVAAAGSAMRARLAQVARMLESDWEREDLEV